MKKLLFVVAVLINSALVYSQKTLTQDTNGNYDLGDGLSVKIGRYLTDAFTYRGVDMSHYALKWGMEPDNFDGPALWMSGYGGLKMFTSGTSRFSIDIGGNIGIGIDTPSKKLDVAGDVLFRQNLILPSGQISRSEGDDLIYQNRSFGHYALGWTGDLSNGSGPALWMSGYGGLRIFTGGLPRLYIDGDGNVGIGKENPQNKLDVAGTIHAQEIKVDMENWADYVFDADYKLPSLKEVKAHIDEHKHLPGIPSQEAVLDNGVNIGELQVKLLQKIEELTLYTIQQDKRIEELEKQLRK